METAITKRTVSEITKAENSILNANQLNFLLARTPKNHIYKRPGKGGEMWDFVTGTYIKKVLNYMFGFDWDFEIMEQIVHMEAKQCIVKGKLTCRTKGHSIIKMQFGRADIKFRKDSQQPLDLGNDLKAASTDALKKCASELGIASDIYGKTEFKEIQVVESRPSEEQLRYLEELLDDNRLSEGQIRGYQMTLATDSAEQVSQKIEQVKNYLKSFSLSEQYEQKTKE